MSGDVAFQGVQGMSADPFSSNLLAPPHSHRLLTEERRREIINLLDREGRVTIGGICKTFGISAVTARSDLDALHSSGALVRSHGGGIRPAAASADFSINPRE